MVRLILLFALVTTVLLTNVSANPATAVEETTAPQVTVAAEAQPEAAVTEPATPAEPAAEPAAAPTETK